MSERKWYAKSIYVLVVLALVLSLAGLIMVPRQVEAQLADTPWPMFHHDLNHTGQSPYLGAQTSDVKWSYATGSFIVSSPAIASDGTIYVGSIDGKFYAINPNGTLKWFYWIGDWVQPSPAIASDGTIYVGSDDYRFYAINPNGTLKWSYTTGGEVRCCCPAIDSDGTIYVGSDDHKLYAINPNGTLKWSYTTGHYVKSSPAICSDGTIYVGSRDGNLYAINPNGTLKWSYGVGGTESSPAIGSDGTIYVGSWNKNLYAINPNGTLKWSYTTGDWVSSSPAIGSDGTIYVGSNDYNLYAINPNGTLKWSYTTGNYVLSSPAIGSDGTIYVGSADNKFYAINPNGTLKWSYTTGDWIHSSPAIGSDGTIYVGSYDYKLYAFGAPLLYTITFDTVPVNTGAITFDGSSYSDGDTVNKAAGTYNIVANPGPGYLFSEWQVEGNIAVTNSTSPATTCTVSGDGTLRMVQTAVPYTVTFDTVPANTGAITFDGIGYSDGDTVSKGVGTYNIMANPAAYYTFTRWETVGGVSVADPNSATTTCTISGDGTLRMVQTEMDTDGDGMPDLWEDANGLNKYDPTDAPLDNDGDGLTNLEEYQNSTDPNNADTDGGGVDDGTEVARGTDPLDPTDDMPAVAVPALTPIGMITLAGLLIVVTASRIRKKK